MALIKCNECGKEISTKASSCPNCGFILKKKTTSYSYLIAIFFVILVIFIFEFWGSHPINQGVFTEIVTFEEYEKISNEMSYQQVVQLIGVEGEELSRNKIEGIPGVMESVETVMYQWINKNGTGMNAIFQNDKLFQKSQSGLE